jgi:succinylarginine dihydrolase
MNAREMNFDSIVGPTHNYSGLSHGNIASTTHDMTVSHPKKAALQGLEKMKFMHDLGVPQAVLPPHERPYLNILREIGYRGTPEQIITNASKHAPELFRRCCSASSMWAANSGWVTPSCDSEEGKVQITPANLSSFFHRSIESTTTLRIFEKIFKDSSHFHVHKPLPAGQTFADEGSANHMLLCAEYGKPGIHIFVYGKSALHKLDDLPRKYPARQTVEATVSIARLHSLPDKQAQHIRQNPLAIDAGVFHNDVISVSNLNLLFCHERAFVHQEKEIDILRQQFEKLCGGNLEVLTVKEKDLSLQDTVQSYLFNSQLVMLPDGTQCLVAPMECREMPQVYDVLKGLFPSLHFVDLKESMANGGGPGCVRLRVVLTDDERKALLPSIVFTDALYKKLHDWIDKHYRDELHPRDLVDPKLYHESCAALQELTQILNLGSIYPFQIVS